MSTEPRTVSEVDEASLREAIRNLGRRDERVRKACRAHILSAGDQALPILLSEIEAGKKERKGRAKALARVVLAIFVASGTTALILHNPLIMQVSHTAMALSVIETMFSMRQPVWMRQAASLLAEFHGPEVTCAMIEAFSVLWGEEERSLKAAIVRRLSAVRPEDAVWLQGDTRRRVIEMLKMTTSTQPTYVDDVLTVGRALCKVGAVEALAAIKRVDTDAVYLNGEKYARLTSGLREIVHELEEMTERQKSGARLLRPSIMEPAVLLRPGSGGNTNDPTQLLRPSDDECLQVNHGRNAERFSG